MKSAFAISSLLLSLLATACASEATEAYHPDKQDAQGDVALLQDSDLHTIWDVHIAEDDQGRMLRLFETGGGDPAFNGNILVLSVGFFDVASYQFADVTQVESFRLEGEVAVIVATEQRPDSSGGFESLSREFRISYSDRGASLSVDGAPETPLDAIEDAASLETLFAVHTLEAPDSQVVTRLFETGGGDPALNGNHLLVSAMSFDFSLDTRAWDTGINVNEVTSVTWMDATEGDTAFNINRIVIETMEDTMDADGQFEQFPMTYAADYIYGLDAIGTALKVTRLDAQSCSSCEISLDLCLTNIDANADQMSEDQQLVARGQCGSNANLCFEDNTCN